MTHARHVTPGPTAARIERLRTLITALQIRALTRDEMAGVLQMGPSGVRKYLIDLKGKCEWRLVNGEEVCALTIDDADAAVFLSGLVANALARPAKAPKSVAAMSEPGRRFHILADDEYHQVRVLRAIPAHEPVHAAFWRMGSAEARA